MMRSRPNESIGSVYIVTVLMCALVATIAAAALSVSRRQSQHAAIINDGAIAESLLTSGIAAALHWPASDVDWRRNYPNYIVNGFSSRSWDVWHALPEGQINVTATLADGLSGTGRGLDSDPFNLAIRTQRGRAQHSATVTVDTQIKPYAVLGYGLYAAGTLEVKSGDAITANGVSVRCQSNSRIDGTIHGDLQTLTRTGSGNVHGALSLSTTALPLPDTAAINRLIAQATVLPAGSNIDKHLIAPSVNTFSASVDPNGLYYLNGYGSDVTVKDSRILGTLIINVGPSKKVTIDTNVLMEPYRAGLPALIVIGNCELKLRSRTESLSEASIKVNFNPPGAPFNGVTNGDQLDTFPLRIDGLVAVFGELKVTETPLVRGPVICAGNVLIDGPLELRAAPDPAAPAPFYNVIGHTLRAGTWRRAP
ncbi:MAG TPA: hypothetical protein VGN72_05795 [Tepidisphaeraceae bacterium]|jgi:hypothetical protein|nr:hypothetical protein [Tepidisphaeraceae bacterium]